MASSPKFGCFFFLLIALIFSLQTHARDIQHFSRVTRNRDTATTTTNPNTYYNTNENEFEHLNKQKEVDQEQPAFIPQTTESGYGLYGHETGLDPPSTPTTTTLYNMDENNNKNNNNYENFNNYYKNNNNNNENHQEKNYATELQGLSGTNVGPSKYFTNNKFNGDQGKYYGGAGYNGVQEKQGMSDTRFLENGKYFYDVENEKNNNFDANNNYMSHSNNYNNNNYNTNGYYGDKENNYEEFNNKNHNNNYYNGNGNGYQQNQILEDDEFDFDQP